MIKMQKSFARIYSRLNEILDFSQNNFFRTSLNFAKSAKINSHKTLFL